MRTLRVLLLLGAVVLPVRAEAHGPPSYPGASPTAIGDVLQLSGSAHRLWYFLTSDDPQAVLRYFHRFWHEQGLPVVVEGDSGALVVSAFDTRAGLQLAVVISAHEKNTLVFHAIKDLRSLGAGRPTTSASALPKLEGTLFSEETAEAGQWAHTRSALLRHDFATTRERVTKSLKAAGFTQASERLERANGERVLVLEHRREDVTVVSTLRTLGSGTTVLFQNAVSASAHKTGASQ